MNKKERLLNHGYKETSVNERYYKKINTDFSKIIELDTDKCYLFYEDEAYRTPVFQDDIYRLINMFNEVKADYEAMIEELEL